MPRPVQTVPCPTCPARYRPKRLGPKGVSCPKCRARRGREHLRELRAAMRDINRALRVEPTPYTPRVVVVMGGDW